MFTKEAIKLAKPCYEAIKKISRNYYNSVSKLPGGGLAETEWEWEPEVGEWCIFGFAPPALIGRVFKETGNLLLWAQPIQVHKSRVTPLLHWERIEEILEGMGYRLTVGVDPDVKPFKTGFECWIGSQREVTQKYEQFVYLKGIKTRQLAVMQAVIELGKEEQCKAQRQMTQRK